MRLLTSTINHITKRDELAMERAKCRWDSIAKPLHSLGLLEDAIVTIAGITQNDHIYLDLCSLLIACSDNGVVEECVTQVGSEVTASVAKNFVRKKTSVCIMAKSANIELFPFDFGMLTEVEQVPAYKTARGTKNFTRHKAMEYEEAVGAIENGILAANTILEKGCHLLCLGEMGIGNTTTSSAVTAALLNIPVKEVTGYGSGLSPQGLLHKIEIIEYALKRHQPDATDVIDVLSKVGGFDIAALCGAILTCASHHIPVLLDGFISCAAALCAVRLCPECQQYLLASHISKEPAGKLLLGSLSLKPLLTCEMCLGEGTGAVAAVPLLKMALDVYNNSSTFEDISIKPYQPF